ncbi:MAG: serine/threonine protein kinase, partial [Planctomycetales bacterium]
GKHSSSPIFADDKLYFLSEAEGESVVAQLQPEFKILARNRLDETCKASMAASGGNLFIRSERNLFCVGDHPK